MTSKDDVFISLETRINGKLVANAAKEAKRQSKILDDSEGYTKLKWTDSCQEVLKAFHSDYYLHISPDAPENRIIQRASVKTTSSELFELLAGKLFALPNHKSTYVAIPLEVDGDGDATVEVVDCLAPDKVEKISWTSGSMLYLKGTMGLRCLPKAGELATVTCIILALNYDDQS